MNLGNTKDYKNILLNNDNKLQGINVDGKFDDDFEPIVKMGEYLDPEAAKAAIEAVANQGKK